MRAGFVSDFKRFFFRGLAAMLPTIITLMILVYIVSFINKYIGTYINTGAKWVVVQFVGVFRHESLTAAGPDEAWELVETVWSDYSLSLIGFLMAFVVVYLFGRFVGSLLGRWIWRGIERTFISLPGVKQVYPHVKQVTDFLLADRQASYSRVVAVEYPRKGLWSLGLVTGAGLDTLNREGCGNLLTVFIPSSPTPVTGYTIVVRRDEVVDLPISIDEALRFTVSGGVIVPVNQKLSEAVLQRAILVPESPARTPDRKENST